jgi:hypothetical protein
MEKQYKNCQSCGMPFARDPIGGGTNRDGSKSHLFCSYCFANGYFTRPDITVDEMRTLVKTKIKEAGFPGFIAHFFTMGLPRLVRWKKD